MDVTLSKHLRSGYPLDQFRPCVGPTSIIGLVYIVEFVDENNYVKKSSELDN